MIDVAANHFMVDCKTLGMGHNPPILAIGVVRFNPRGIGIADEVYFRIDPKNALRYGKADGDMFCWWLDQPDETRHEITQGGGIELSHALDRLTLFMRNSPSADGISRSGKIGGVWSKGDCTDITWLESVYPIAHWPVPWNCSDVRDFSTIRWLCPDVKYEDYLDDSLVHNALADARAQALALQEMLRRISVRELEPLSWLRSPNSTTTDQSSSHPSSPEAGTSLA